MSERGLVTIDGIDGSGKSVLARRLRQALGDSAALLAVDDFRRPVAWQASPRSELDLYYEDRYDLVSLEGCIRQFLQGAEACTFPEFDGAREALAGTRSVDLAGKRWLLVEGVFVARLPSADGALSIYVDIDEDEARRRVTTRDMAKGRTAEEVSRRIDRRYFPAHQRYRQERSPRDRAAVLIDNTDPLRPRLLRTPASSRDSGSRAAASGFAPVHAALAELLALSP
jgi:uridine kinase